MSWIKVGMKVEHTGEHLVGIVSRVVPPMGGYLGAVLVLWETSEGEELGAFRWYISGEAELVLRPY